MTNSQYNDFSACTVKFAGITNRVVSDVQVFRAFDPALPPSSDILGAVTHGLWDTGATNSVITAETARSLRLEAVGQVDINHAGGSSPSPLYVINMLLPNNVLVPGIVVSECPGIAGNFGAIIGMDIISQGDLSITNHDGLTCMTFRIPSIAAIDYVVEANRIRFAGVNRNDPCPCGAVGSDGKKRKFKKCCGLNLR